MAEHQSESKKSKPFLWRNLLRNLHRDAGFFAVGLTFIYAISGLAVNHIGDWNPSFSDYKKLYSFEEPLPKDEGEAVAGVLSKLEFEDEPIDTFTRTDTIVRFEIELDGRSVEVVPDRDEILLREQGSEETTVYPLGDPLPAEDWQAAVTALARIGIEEEPSKVERVSYPVRLIDVSFENRTLRIRDHKTGYEVYEEGQDPRPFLHVANWLHLNRGKAAWTWIADGYAIILLFLATSGMLMVRGRKGLVGRGGIFLLLGIAVPVLYLLISGGP